MPFKPSWSKRSLSFGWLPGSDATGPRAMLWGMLTRRERWGLSPCGWLTTGFALLLFTGLVLLTVHPFLAATHRVDAHVLVVEGWVHDFAIGGGVKEFQTGAYERIFTTGGPVTGNGGYTGDQDTGASVGAARLRAMGVVSASVQMVPSRAAARDRTYNSAVALRDWFRENQAPVRRINVVTEGVHARRTQLLFQEAFGKSVEVGIIAVPNPDYDARHWWCYSEGVREVIGESIAYIYAKLFFHPSEGTTE